MYFYYRIFLGFTHTQVEICKLFISLLKKHALFCDVKITFVQEYSLSDAKMTETRVAI
jgi:hypothetical protein